jgi:hypothetical protein
MTTNTYECNICLNINHATKLHCSTCGTIPTQYSVIGVPARLQVGLMFPIYTSDRLTPVVIAKGADRAEHHKTSRVYLRTVKADYYATE